MPRPSCVMSPDMVFVKELIDQGRLPAPRMSVGEVGTWDFGGLAEISGISRHELIRLLAGVRPRFGQTVYRPAAEFSLAD